MGGFPLVDRGEQVPRVSEPGKRSQFEAVLRERAERDYESRLSRVLRGFADERLRSLVKDMLNLDSSKRILPKKIVDRVVRDLPYAVPESSASGRSAMSPTDEAKCIVATWPNRVSLDAVPNGHRERLDKRIRELADRLGASHPLHGQLLSIVGPAPSLKTPNRPPMWHSGIRVVQDPVHGLMEFIRPEAFILDLLRCSEVQRLRRVKQLGFACFVFPGAEHSRFPHSVGSAYLAARIGRHLHEVAREMLPESLQPDPRAYQDFCVAGLCHDLGHGPFSHVWERVVIRSDWDRRSGRGSWKSPIAMPGVSRTGTKW